MVDVARRARSVLLFAAVVVAAGCGGESQDAQVPITTPTLPSGGASPDQLAPPGDLADIPATLAPAPTVSPGPWRAVTVLPWQFVRLDDENRRLAIRYLPAAGCQLPLGVAVQETDTTVLVGPLAAERTQGPCPAVAYVPTYGAVQLSAPLGKRTLLHAPPPPEFADMLRDWPGSS